MEYLPKLTVISALLDIQVSQSFTGVHIYTGIWMEYYGML